MRWCAMDIDRLTQEQYEAVYSAMPLEQQARVKAFRFAQDRKRTVAAQLLARQMIGAFCGVPEMEIVFRRTEEGKPYPVGLPVSFSVSHCQKLVVCAVSERPVGIDVERLRPVDIKIARKICTPAEESALLAGEKPGYTEDPEKILQFFRLWTAKEAMAKAEGKGIGSLRRQDTKNANLSYEMLDDYLICIATV